jgi:outer membrane lipopolysaccharide assembly protein LptE/RlpB
MRTIGSVILLGIVLALAGCGSNSHNGSINGNWTAVLMSSNSSNPAFKFTTTLTQTSGTGVSVTNLTFTTSSPCFASGTTSTGGFTVSGNQNGVTSGGFQMDVQSTGSSNNLLTLQGTLDNNTISGNWNLTGTTAGCSGSGTFVMNRS